MEQKPKLGRPSKYTPELADAICARLSQGESLRSVCRDENMPCLNSVFSWMRLHESFMKQYAKAKEESADAMAEEILDIADDGTNDYYLAQGKDGKEYLKFDKEAVMRSRLRVDTRRWLMAKMKPKRYGDKLDMTSGGNAIKPTPILNVFTDYSDKENNSFKEKN